MINWKEFWIGFLGGTCVLLFIASINQHEKYERVKKENEALKWELKVTKATVLVKPASVECSVVFADRMLNCQENKIWKGK